MDLDEQIADMETITEPTTVTEWISLDSRYAILASLRELKRLHDVGYSSPALDDDEDQPDGQ